MIIKGNIGKKIVLEAKLSEVETIMLGIVATLAALLTGSAIIF